jgi:adenosylhomocysteine nucleosidase
MKRDKIGFITGLASEARLLKGAGFLVRTGGGTPEGAWRAAQALLAEEVEALVSFGLAGGLSPKLRPGTVLVPKAVLDNNRTYPCSYLLMERLGGSTGQVILAGKRIAASAEDKAFLFRSTRADAIDLESGAIARAATAAGIDFAVLRAIIDPAQISLPPAALVPLQSTGAINPGGVLASVLMKPMQLPALLALAGNDRLARRALRERIGQIK